MIEWEQRYPKPESLIGKVITKFNVMKDKNYGEDQIEIETEDGMAYLIEHDRDCCEYVRIIDECGDPDEMIGGTIKYVNKMETDVTEDKYGDIEMFTQWVISLDDKFYSAQWRGTSNGYYGVSVGLKRVR